MKPGAEFLAREAAAGAKGAAVAGGAAAAAVIAIILMYLDTAAAIVSIWRRSDTFAHGFVVLPIVGWLVWRLRARLMAISARPWYPGLAVVAAAGVLWLLGAAGGIAGAMHFAFAFMLQAAVMTVVGLRMAREMAFPLGFVLFGVPFGEFLVPVLMEHTANFTVAALQATGIPVFREGNHFIIPTGRWSVVEACSGVRYLGASLMAGTLYAYLSYRSYYRRAMFVALSIAVPIVANWVRAYLTVMVGHLFGGDVVAGFIHIVYGWVFFGVVMGILFFVGSLWREDEIAAAPMPDLAATPRSFDPLGGGSLQVAIAASLALLIALPWAVLGRSLAGNIEVAQVRIQAPPGAAGWATSDVRWTQWRPAFVAPSAEIRRTYQAGATQVSLYVAYYVEQAQGRELITSVNTFSDFESWEWKTVAEDRATLSWIGGDQQANVVTVAGPGQYLQVAYLYWINGKLTASPYVAKALTTWAKTTGQDDRAAVVAIYTADASEQSRNGLATLQEFAAAMSPEIDRVLRAAVRE